MSTLCSRDWLVVNPEERFIGHCSGNSSTDGADLYDDPPSIGLFIVDPFLVRPI